MRTGLVHRSFGAISLKVHSRTPARFLTHIDLTVRQNQDVLLLFGEAQLSPGQSGRLQLPLGLVELPPEGTGALLFPGDPVQRHLRPHVVVEGPVGVVGDHLLPAALPLPHRLQAAVPVEQLEDRHQFLEFQHRPALVRLEHEPEGADARVGVVGFLGIALEGGARFRHGLLDEVVGYPPGGVFVENGVHQGYFGGASSSFGLRGTILQTMKRKKIVCFLFCLVASRYCSRSLEDIVDKLTRVISMTVFYL